jgi:hypothetical protein
MAHIAPGVIGHTEERDGAHYILLLAAVDEGRGDVGRYLDLLPRDRRIVVPNVLNDILAGMLKRRGFKLRTEIDDEGPIAIWERRPSTAL